jgi:serine/threonine protein kinase
MSGVEIHANAIATLLENRSVAEAIPNPSERGLFVLIGVVGAGFLITRIKNLPIRLALAAGVILAWAGVSCVLFVFGRVILPTAVPVIAIALSSLTYGTIGSIRDYFYKINIGRFAMRYSSSPIIQEMISQEDELQGLLEQREIELLETKLSGRYKLIKRLSSGGFGETYIAEDTQRPGNPQCVVKQLRPASNNPQLWKLAKRLFVTEAEILEKLGKHEQIPQLLAHFEEAEEFYLVEEFIVGRPLTDELPLIVPLSESKVVAILRDVLQVLEFIHAHNVIHRDIKPDNIIRRQSDGKLVLIDFGAVKELQTQLTEGEQQTDLTVGIGTKGYMPNEQAAGTPKCNSDIYSLGMIAIQGLTVTHPAHLPSDPRTGEVIWQDKASISPTLAAILKKMVHYNFRDRYQSATEVLEALHPLIAALPPELASRARVMDQPRTRRSSSEDIQDSTQVRSEPSSVQDAQESTRVRSELSSGQEEEEESTRLWSQSSSLQDEEESTRVRSESLSLEEEESTRLWPESSSPHDSQDSAKP